MGRNGNCHHGNVVHGNIVLHHGVHVDNGETVAAVQLVENACSAHLRGTFARHPIGRRAVAGRHQPRLVNVGNFFGGRLGRFLEAVDDGVEARGRRDPAGGFPRRAPDRGRALESDFLSRGGVFPGRNYFRRAPVGAYPEGYARAAVRRFLGVGFLSRPSPPLGRGSLAHQRGFFFDFRGVLLDQPEEFLRGNGGTVPVGRVRHVTGTHHVIDIRLNDVISGSTLL